MMTQHRELCLASSSPRRQALLKRYGLEFAVCSPNIDESQKPSESVQTYAKRMAYEKAQVGAAHTPEAIVLAGDTTVYFKNEVLGKPSDAKEAQEMLQRLSGQQHEVYSSYALLDARSNQAIESTPCTRVTFKTLPADWIRWYTTTGEPMDKAGAYSIQGLGAVMVEKIDGSYNNVVGLPIEEIFWHLLQQGWIALN